MAQQDAMEQVKEFLRQLIRHRFWIAITVAAMFAVGAYVLGSGPVKAKAAEETKKITDAESGVKKYASSTVPTDQYKPIVEEKTEVLTKDVNTAWKELFDRQAPLLTWPDIVQERFRKWGRAWPADEDPGKVHLAIVDYIYAYPAYVDMVYKTFRPFDYESGAGVVAAPPKPALLRPSVFQVERPPDLGTVWACQERLWIQHTLLYVVDQVNKKAKDWDSAIIKEIQVLEVGNPMAQDQRSLAKGEQLEKAAGIYAPGQEPQAEEAGGGGAAGGAGMGGAMQGMMMGQMMRGRGGKDMGEGGGMMGGALAGGGSQYDQDIYYINPPNEASKQQYKILPVFMTVLIDQDHVQDFLVQLENSPMSIEVKDFEWQRPPARVNKPEKGTQPGGFGMGMGMGGMMGQMMMMGRGMKEAGGSMSGYGGMMGQMMGMQMGMMRQGGRGMPGMMGEMGGMGPMGGMGMQAERKGIDVRGVDAAKKRKEAEKALEQSKGPSLFDPYFDIVQVTIYGQARFFNPPPEEPKPEPSPGETVAPAEAAAPGDAAPPATPPAVPNPAAPAAPTAPAAGAPAGAPAPAPNAEPAPPVPEGDPAKPAVETPPAGTPAPSAKAEGTAPKP